MNLHQSAQSKSLPQTCFFLGFIRSTDHWTTGHSPTNPLTTGPTIRWISNHIWKTWQMEIHSSASVYYPKSLLVSIKHVRRSQLYLFVWFLNFNTLFLPRYFKVTFYAWLFFFFISWCEFYIVSWGNWPTKAVICTSLNIDSLYSQVKDRLHYRLCHRILHSNS